ncbi:Nucleoside-diphosphate-sugar epimerase [Pedobacter suwonensis]|uniref:Nucleoside-diphosphate-sugar epimerase n=1 Tax=Pedobacter suwonensis TaxID=332999 RepID=A0A1I0STX5_9SPHI|nr:NAD-dependent epimerase/dehydratase family protein [Pedobacter suwonensis]SFA42216.1 Nucleoside-diphosphate-sugar epimerase [Pedobacter suwonensis]
MMRVILTGASGFLGKYIYNELCKAHDVITISRSGASHNLDLAKVIPVLEPADLVIHVAGKAHSVPKTAAEKQAFFDVNKVGTLNLLKGLEQSAAIPRFFVFISTVAVYGKESGILINENTSLEAKDPYGESKIQAERLISKWCAEKNVVCTILRLPLLVGENPPGNLGAMIKGLKKGYYFNIAGGKARKSMVMAADVAKIIPVAAKIGGIYNLTDGYHPSFEELSMSIAKQLSKGHPVNLPLWLAKVLAGLGDILGNKSPINTRKLVKIRADLTFDDRYAREQLNWNPKSVLEGFRLK